MAAREFGTLAFLLLLQLAAICIATKSSAKAISTTTSVAYGPGIDPKRNHLPVSYFYVQAVRHGVSGKKWVMWEGGRRNTVVLCIYWQENCRSIHYNRWLSHAFLCLLAYCSHGLYSLCLGRVVTAVSWVFTLKEPAALTLANPPPLHNCYCLLVLLITW